MKAGKVIHISDNIRPGGGAEVYAEQLVRLLPAFGWETDWLGVRRRGRRAEVLRYGQPGWSWEGDLSSFRQLVKDELGAREKSLLHVHNISEPKLVKTLFEAAPVVRTMHDPRMFCPGQGKFWYTSEVPCEKPFGMHCLAHAYTQRCCNRHPKRLLAGIMNTRFEVHEGARGYVRVIANSHFMKSQAMLAGMAEGKITVLPCFTEEVPPVEASPVRESKRLLFSGRLSTTKGVHYLLRAFALVREKMPIARLDIVGAGADQERFVRLAGTLVISPAVTFHGWCSREKLNCLIAESSVVAFPSICPEAFGMGGIEAMMQGRPVVAFDVGGVREWLQPGVTGILVPPRNVNAFAAAVLKLLSSGQTSLAMGKAARAAALRKFSERRHLNAIVSLYERAVFRGRRSEECISPGEASCCAQ